MADLKRSVFAQQEVQITFVSGRSGKEKTIPVWFTVEGGKMELLPMYGLKTKWFADVEASGRIRLAIGEWEKDAEPEVVKEPRAVEEVKRRFAAKYGSSKVKRYYPTSEVALEAPV